MAKLFMLQTALANLTQEGTAEINGTGWRIALDNENILYVDCGDEGFRYQVYYTDEQSWSIKEELETVSELNTLIAGE
jgi:hypothetical protein